MSFNKQGSSSLKRQEAPLKGEKKPQALAARKLLSNATVRRKLFKRAIVNKTYETGHSIAAAAQTDTINKQGAILEKDCSLYGFQDVGAREERISASTSEKEETKSHFITSNVSHPHFIAENCEQNKQGRENGKSDTDTQKSPADEAECQQGKYQYRRDQQEGYQQGRYQYKKDQQKGYRYGRDWRAEYYSDEQRIGQKQYSMPGRVNKQTDENTDNRGKSRSEEGGPGARTAFRTIDESYQKSKRFIKGTGRFAKRFSSSADETQEEKEKSIQQTPETVARHAYRIVQNAMKNTVNTVKLALQVMLTFLSSGALMLGGLMLPVIILVFVGCLLLAFIITAVLSIFLGVLLLILNALMGELGGCDMYQYAYDYTQAYIDELKELPADEIHCYVNGAVVGTEDVKEIEINYQEAYLVYLALNDPATYINDLLELADYSEPSALKELQEETEKNKKAFEKAFSYLYYYEYDEEESIAEIYFWSWDNWYNGHLFDQIDTNARINNYEDALMYDEQKEMIGTGKVFPLKYEIK